MKDYKDVVRERYDKEQYHNEGRINNQYAIFNPVGFYGSLNNAKVLRNFIFDVADSTNKSFEKLKICDCGCGNGFNTRVLAEFLGNPDGVYGTEYSVNRLQFCKEMNPLIHYEYADLTDFSGRGMPFGVKFDGVTAFDVFMHFTKEEEIINALRNIYDALEDKGIFLWFDPKVESHWDGLKKDIDGWGYSAKEMDEYAARVGFKLKKKQDIYSIIPLKKISTVYLARRIKNLWILELLESLPFKKNNQVRIYCKV